jgi:AcrR family transcriptional regulator
VSHPSARERILQEGLNLASTRGLFRVTFGAVARRANLSKSGIVAHFSSMDSLKCAIVDQAMELWSGACFGSAAGNLSGMAQLTQYLKDWISWTRRAGLPGACPSHWLCSNTRTTAARAPYAWLLRQQKDVGAELWSISSNVQLLHRRCRRTSTRRNWRGIYSVSI